MNGFLLLIPVLLIRYVLLFGLNKEAMKRAAHFPPMIGAEKAAFWVYQLSTVAIIIYIFFLKVRLYQPWFFYTGMVLYVAGLILLTIAAVNFAAPSNNGINRNGLYRLSRNPIYMAYFICFAGCAALTRSLVLLGLIFFFQVSAHWIILSEERWCKAQFGEEYLLYMKKVRRYV
jgi:protein-S-isoprenylcysteine O-methyltransferase Ste14